MSTTSLKFIDAAVDIWIERTMALESRPPAAPEPARDDLADDVVDITDRRRVFIRAVFGIDACPLDLAVVFGIEDRRAVAGDLDLR